MESESLGVNLPRKVRVSIGSAVILGLQKGRLDAAPTTAYLMTFKRGKCNANCGFCPQAKLSRGKADMLSRISWPAYATNLILNGIENAFRTGKIRRVCIQALNYPRVIGEVNLLVRRIRSRATVPISVSCQPLNHENMIQLANAGVERIGIPIDAATEKIFDRVKGFSVNGPYFWERQFELLSDALKIFGKGRVSTHLIVGLGETEREMIDAIQTCVNMSVLPALFAFTPIPGTALQARHQPLIERYRKMQVARHLIVSGIVKSEDMGFDDRDDLTDFGVDRRLLLSTVQSGMPFLTSGCPDCNRPYYNEKPSGPIYNYPRKLSDGEVFEILRQFGFSEKNLCVG